MRRGRKLQIFISSTYKDLIKERQGAVEAILTAGHIPAGMELFLAGNQSQMEVIKRWIDESDIYLLILGSRYGSVETNSGKSYTQLEYEYAQQSGKPLFSVVISDTGIRKKVEEANIDVLEQANPQKLNDFRSTVTSNMVRFFDDVKDIKLAILEKMSEFNSDESLIGWIPGSEGVSGTKLAEEIARLSKENAELKALTENTERRYNNFTFHQIYDVLVKTLIANDEFQPVFMKYLRQIASLTGHDQVNLLHLLLSSALRLKTRSNIKFPPQKDSVQTLLYYDLFDRRPQNNSADVLVSLSSDGKHFVFKFNSLEHGIDVGNYTIEKLQAIHDSYISASA